MIDGLNSKGDDPNDPPAPTFCIECNSKCPWPWAKGSGTIPGHFLRPANVCKVCRGRQDSIEAREALQASQRASGIPAKYMGYKWGRNLGQRPGESTDHFVSRVENAGRETLGIFASNRAPATAFRDWRPASKKWMFIHGHTGAGKTLFASCLATGLLSVPLGFRRPAYEELPGKYKLWVDRGGIAPLVRTGGWSVFFISEFNLHREQLNWYTQVRNDRTAVEPVGRARSVQVLILDDLGTAKGSEKWGREIEALIDHRYNAGLPTIITSNMPLFDIGGHFNSQRLHSRLAEMVGQRCWDLQVAADWREVIGELPVQGES